MLSSRRTIRGGKSHAGEYERFEDGRLIVGSQCFSSVNLLKARFASEESAKEFLVSSGQSKKQRPYRCYGCRGWHLTKKKSRKRRRSA